LADLRPILLVEDNAKDLELTLAALAKCQLANGIVVARDGAEAIDYLYSEGAHADRDPGDPAVVLLDLKLPKVDGLEVLAKVKTDMSRRQIPVVMLTSSREERDLIQSYELGVNAFVVKPVDFNAFFEAIQDLGMFWAVLNEPPPRGASALTRIRNGGHRVPPPRGTAGQPGAHGQPDAHG
jgi:CheY-like chemotaxis protein